MAFIDQSQVLFHWLINVIDRQWSSVIACHCFPLFATKRCKLEMHWHHEHGQLSCDCDFGLVFVLSPVSTTRIHGPSSQAELTARELWCIF